MSRKPKVGIDYFSHDVDMLQDIKVKLVKAKYGLIGYAVYLRLLEETYRDCGYYVKIDDNFNILFSDENNIPLNDYILILNDCINNGLFDKKLYDAYNILTSCRIQINYCAATERRKEIGFISEYLLIDTSKYYNHEKVNVNIYPINADINSINPCKSTQSKVKKSKEVYVENSIEFQLSKLLYDCILQNNPNHKNPDFQKWAEQVDKMIRLDKRTPKQIEYLIRWTQNDSFWKGNILSTKKLRDQFDQLAIKVKEVKNNKDQPKVEAEQARLAAARKAEKDSGTEQIQPG